jgi:hypothetical protein
LGCPEPAEGAINSGTENLLTKGSEMALRLTTAFTDNPRVQPLKDGTVKPENTDLDSVIVDAGALFFRNLKYDEFDAFEMSIAETLLALERSDGLRWDWSALPVFLSRGHVWPTLYVNTVLGIEHLGDVKANGGLYTSRRVT